jgi:rhodanese-related sulfurtransferase
MRQICHKKILGSLLLAMGIPAALAAQFTQSSARVTPDTRYNKAEFAEAWPHISLAEAKRLHGREGVVFVDGRSMNDWKQSRIPGSLALPTGEFDKRYPPLRARLRKAEIMVQYCHGESCAQADFLAQVLAAKGHKNIAVFWGGFPAWKKAGLGLEGKQAAGNKNRNKK